MHWGFDLFTFLSSLSSSSFLPSLFSGFRPFGFRSFCAERCRRISLCSHMNKIEYTQSRQSEGGNDISASVFGFPMSTRCSLPSQNDWKKRKITAYALTRNNIISSLPQKRPFASANFREVPPIKKKKKSHQQRKWNSRISPSEMATTLASKLSRRSTLAICSSCFPSEFLHNENSNRVFRSFAATGGGPSGASGGTQKDRKVERD